jgi:hypothetical protein
MGIFEFFMIIFIPTGTFLLNAWRGKMNGTKRWPQFAYLFISMVMAMSPLIYVHSIEPNHTALAVALAGVAFFWFAIVGARRART